LKIKVTAKRGELQDRLPDVIAVLRKMAGQRLEKAVKSKSKPKTEDEHEPKNLPLPILDEYTDMASAMGEKIRKRMEEKMLAVLKGM
jgi:hypothetical protein